MRGLSEGRGSVLLMSADGCGLLLLMAIQIGLKGLPFR